MERSTFYSQNMIFFCEAGKKVPPIKIVCLMMDTFFNHNSKKSYSNHQYVKEIEKVVEISFAE